MGVALRLARHGVKKKPYYRIVATPKGTKRDGRFLEIVGSYDPNQSPAKIILKDDKVKKWLAQGAIPTEVVRTILIKNLPGVVEERENNKRQKIQARRKLRKAKNPKKATAEKGSSKKSSKKSA